MSKRMLFSIRRLFRFFAVSVLFLISACKTYSLDSIPYVMTGEFVMEENAADYSICGVDIFLLNKSEKAIKNINLVFFLFDQDGEPAYECRNKISLEIERKISAGEKASFCVSLDNYMNSIPSNLLLVDYLYLAKIEYEDGSCWEDPYGLTAFK